jgi:hypothetical protein
MTGGSEKGGQPVADESRHSGNQYSHGRSAKLVATAKADVEEATDVLE